MAKTIQIDRNSMVVFMQKGANLYTLATNQIDFDSTHLFINVQSQASGFDINGGNVIAGDNVDIIDVKPPYLPYMVEGAFYSGITGDLTACDLELTDYQYISLTDGLFLVWGICGATQTDFYTPRLMTKDHPHALWKTNFTKRLS